MFKNELVDPATAIASADDIFARRHAEIYAEYQTRLERAGAADFDDLLTVTVRLLNECPDVLDEYRGRFRHLLVDEYQDTNMAQNEIVLALGGATDPTGAHNVCVVGDSDQSVYRLRADLRNIIQFEDAFADVTTIVLDQNYRSTQTILDAANAVIVNNPDASRNTCGPTETPATASFATTQVMKAMKPRLSHRLPFNSPANRRHVQ